ncbi:MAG: tetratricopeptide repeat protein [Chitinophagaceae bacterium]|jgi:signal transduction histidine kinase|nr:tetratricopeptide repeat protein [Chitinophagaceae bacterium]
MLKTRLAFVLCLAVIVTAHGQTRKADSLSSQLQRMAPDSNYVRTQNLLSEELADKNADKALQFAEASLELAKELGYTAGIAQSLNNMAWAAYRKGDYSKGFDYATRALRINDSIHNIPQLAFSYRAIGAIFNSQSRYREAIDYFRKEKSLQETLGNTYAVGRSLNNIAFCAQRGKMKDSAMILANEALEYNVKQHDKGMISFSLRTLGDLYYDDNAIPRSIDYYLAAASAAREAKSNFLLETALYRIGKSFQLQREWKKSLSYLEEANRISLELGAKSERATINRLLAESYAALGEYKLAYEASSLGGRLNDTLYEERNRARFAQMQVQFDTERKEAEIKLLKKEDELQKNKIQDQRVVTISLLAIVGLVLTLWIIAWRRNQFKQEVNKQLSAQKLALEQASYQKDKIFSILSHDLRLPISSLSNVMSLMEKQGISAEAFEKIKHALGKQIHSLTNTLDNLLLWSRNQMDGVTNTQPEHCMVHDVVERNRQILDSAAILKKIMITNDAPVLTNVYADPQHLDIIIRNLLLNALKFTHEGGYIHISVLENIDTVTIQVADNGVGMTHDQVERLFRLNTHFTTTGTRNEKGAGLGLLLCKEFVEANHGKLTVSSEPGNGSVFSVTLPKNKA